MKMNVVLQSLPDEGGRGNEVRMFWAGKNSLDYYLGPYVCLPMSLSYGSNAQFPVYILDLMIY